MDENVPADLERASTFPICQTPEAFDAFFKGKRELLYDSRAREAFRSVQPFVNLEEDHKLGVALEEASRTRPAGASCIVSTPCGTSTSIGA